METKITNYARFYCLLSQMTGADKDELKEQLVWQFTNCRTESLREMKADEYNKMCASMERSVKDKLEKWYITPLTPKTVELKKYRSAVLKRLQLMGIDTTDFANVDNVLLNPRIAGKVFRELTIEELKALIPKLESIRKKDEKSSLKWDKSKLN